MNNLIDYFPNFLGFLSMIFWVIPSIYLGYGVLQFFCKEKANMLLILYMMSFLCTVAGFMFSWVQSGNIISLW